MSFSWEDKYNPSDVPNRQVRRAIEKENKKFRDIARKKYNETVRALALYIRKRDPRVMRFELESRDRKIEEERKKIEMKLELESKRKEKRELSRIALESNGEEVVRRQQEREGAFLLADYESDDGGDDYKELAEGDIEDIKAKADYKMLNIDESASLESDHHAEDGVCDICSKTFKTEAQLLQHLASKNHRKKAQEMEKKSKKNNSSKTANKGIPHEKQSSNGKVRPVIACFTSDSESESDNNESIFADNMRIKSEDATSNNRKESSRTTKRSSSSTVSDSDVVMEEQRNTEKVFEKSDHDDSVDSDDSSRGVRGKKMLIPSDDKKRESVLDYATASLRNMNIRTSDSDLPTDPIADADRGEKQKNKYKKKEKVGYFPKSVIREATVTLFPEDSLDPILHGDGVDVAIMPGPQKKKSKKISLRGF